MIESIVVMDIETLRSIFLVCVYDPKENKNYDFEVSRRKNQMDSLLKFIETHKEYYWVSYNGLRFDAQVVEWIIRNHDNWIDLSTDEIVAKIYQKAQDIIDDANYDVFSYYREDQLSFKQIDLFSIFGYNNENKRTSLKALEFSLRLENIEEMPVDIHSKDLSDKELDDVISYCFNDVYATYEFYKVAIGDTDLALYKGENKIEDRLIMQEEFGLPCLNWDNIKIGAEWNKLDYIKETGLNEKDLKPKEVRHFYGKRFKQFFPKTVSFQTKELKKFISDFGNTFALNHKQEFNFTFSNGLVATIGKGGIHSGEQGRFIKPSESEIYIQTDIGLRLWPN